MLKIFKVLFLQFIDQNVCTMKNLKFLVMTEEICSDYSRQVIDGICHLCSQKKIECVVCNVRHPKYSEGVFEYQYWAGAKLLEVKDVDVVIVLTGIYFSTYTCLLYTSPSPRDS